MLLAGDALMTDHALARFPGPQLLPDFFHVDTARARASLEVLVDLEAEVVIPGHGPAYRGTPASAVAKALELAPEPGESTSPPLRIEYGAELPAPPAEAFTFVSDPRNWPTFFASLVSASGGDDWGCVGGQGRMTTTFLGRTVVSDLELTTWDPPREFRYRSRQPGAPDLDNRRTFEPTSSGTRLRGTTVVVPRAGVAGWVDRAQVLALRRLYAGAMRRLPEVIGARPEL